MLFDPVLDKVYTEDEFLVEPGGFNKPLMCAHCYRPIKGRYYQSGKNYYDEFCWQFRFVIDPIYIEKSKRTEVKEYDEDGYEI